MKHQTKDTSMQHRTISVHASPQTWQRLDSLAKETRRSKSFLANDAIERYLSAEESFISNIKSAIHEADRGEGYTTPEIKEKFKERMIKKFSNASS